MSSILTNTGAMVALQSLKSINSGLQKTQSEISTGKSVANAKDNSAIWAISKVMESDVQGFKAISSSLALGESTVAVARQASETVTDLLTQMKDKIVAAQSDNLPRDKLQADVQAFTDQIASVVGAAQFNGLNLVNGSQTANNSNSVAGVDILSSLDRDSGGNVTVSNIGVDAQNLSQTAGTTLTAAAASMGTPVTALTENGGATDSFTIDTFAFQGGGAALAKNDPAVVLATATGLIEGDTMRLKIGDTEALYTVKTGDTAESVTGGLKNALQAAGIDENAFTLDISTAGELTVTNETNEAGIGIEFEATRGTGALAQLGTLDVSTEAGATSALANIEGMIQAATSAAASFGSVQGRIETQASFVSNLTDSLKAGIGSLVDADMEEASARLQALQTQQQLGIQSLSIANQAPQSILSLFR
ncbi:flagellin [Oceaniglobus indicus]|uniref:flagellin n=1 Tax=Oceaniglobus indicus TaxID=2047749 RepID=UPI000C195041|nr:flagellin [Oceaniglobus indicus]